MRRGRDADGVLRNAGDAVGEALGAAAVQAEAELVEVALEVLAADGTVEGLTGEGASLTQPPLGEADKDRVLCRRRGIPRSATDDRAHAISA